MQLNSSTTQLVLWLVMQGLTLLVIRNLTKPLGKNRYLTLMTTPHWIVIGRERSSRRAMMRGLISLQVPTHLNL